MAELTPIIWSLPWGVWEDTRLWGETPFWEEYSSWQFESSIEIILPETANSRVIILT